MSTNSHSTDRPTDAAAEHELSAHLEDDGDGTTLTLYPSEVSPDDWTTTWISADAGSFVTLSEMR